MPAPLPPLRLSCVLLLVSGLSGCAHHVQTTSGEAFLARHDPRPRATGTVSSEASFEERLARVASKEPTLRFPARIGLARLEHGRISGIPALEAEVWAGLAERLGAQRGEFVPVSPLIAQLARAEASAEICGQCAPGVAEIRFGAAAQHLDAVLVYEAVDTHRDQSNALSIAKLTILGGFLLPTTSMRARTVAQALLIDVMQGYPYGQARVEQAEDALMTTWGSDGARRTLAERTRVAALTLLADDVRAMMEKLRWRLAEQRLDAPPALTQ